MLVELRSALVRPRSVLVELRNVLVALRSVLVAPCNVLIELCSVLVELCVRFFRVPLGKAYTCKHIGEKRMPRVATAKRGIPVKSSRRISTWTRIGAN